MFTTDADFRRADWELLRNGAVTLFTRGIHLDNAVAALGGLDYAIGIVKCDLHEHLLADLTSALQWREQFGYEPWTGNLDALRDGFGGDQPFPPSGCLALCFLDFDELLRRDEHAARAVLDIVEEASRDHLLHGHRLVALVQTEDLSLSIAGLGARTTTWNRAEWAAGRGVHVANDRPARGE